MPAPLPAAPMPGEFAPIPRASRAKGLPTVIDEHARAEPLQSSTSPMAQTQPDCDVHNSPPERPGTADSGTFCFDVFQAEGERGAEQGRFDSPSDVAFPIVQASKPETPPPPPQEPEEIFAQLQEEARDPIELAALARLRVWETGRVGYTVEEAMTIVRWLQAELAPPKPTPPPWTAISLKLTGPRARVALSLCVATAVLLLLTLVSCCTGIAFEATKFAVLDESGLLVDGGSRRPVGVATAFSLHRLRDFPTLPTTELRLAQDVVVSHAGELHFYRVANVAKLPDESVRVTSEDGAVIRIEAASEYTQGRVHIGLHRGNAPLGNKEETVQRVSDIDIWSESGSFRALAQHLPEPPDDR